MLYAFISLTALALILFVFSFLKEDKTKTLEKQLDQLSLTVLKNSYQTNKRLNFLEEELLVIPVEDVSPAKPSSKAHFAQQEELPVQKQALILKENGLSIEAIAKKLSIPIEEASLLLEQQKWEEYRNG